jgi:hypothetical protein
MGAAFLLRGSIFCGVEGLRMGAGPTRLVEERTIDEVWPLEKPLTMLCELRSVEVLASEPTGGLMLENSLPIAVATVEVDDSGTMWACTGGGEDGRGVVSSEERTTVGAAGAAASCGGRGESGSSSCFSLIEFTIFSRSTGVMCFSLPLLLLSVES